MTRQKRNDKAVLLRIPVPTIEKIDAASREQNVTRTQFLRQSIDRNLDHFEENERSIFHHLNGQEYL